MLAVECRPLTPEHGPADLQRLLQPFEPLLHRREVHTERGVLVRAGSSLGREGALRVTVGTAAENARFVDVLGTLL